MRPWVEHLAGMKTVLSNVMLLISAAGETWDGVSKIAVFREYERQFLNNNLYYRLVHCMSSECAREREYQCRSWVKPYQVLHSSNHYELTDNTYHHELMNTV